MPTNQDILHQLQKDILQIQGSKPLLSEKIDLGLGPVNEAFPLRTFPTGAIHELISTSPASTAASCGFMAALIGTLMQHGGASVWITKDRKIYPPALKAYGITPDHIIFMQCRNDKQALWLMEESLKCDGLAAVVAEIRDINMTQSRRFQLAVEQSRVTGFILRQQPRSLVPTASVARWHITHLPSEAETAMPGIGHERWRIELSRIRNGHTGSWQTTWQAGNFEFKNAPAHDETFSVDILSSSHNGLHHHPQTGAA